MLRSPILSQFAESVAGASTIRAFQRTEQFRSTARKLLSRNLMAHYPSISANRWLAVRLETVGSVMVSVSALLTLFNRSSITPALAGLSISYALTVTQALNWIVRMTSDRE